jgi:hypothetical protein
VQNPKPFTVFQPNPGQTAKPLFVIHAYSLEQARALVAAKVAGETIIVGPVSFDGEKNVEARKAQVAWGFSTETSR